MNKNTLGAFSIIEVLIGIFVFSMGLISVYALLVSSLSVNDYNRNAIIASNLAREQIELFRNIRDTNYKKLQVWNQTEPQTNNFGIVFTPDTLYTLENNMNNGEIMVDTITFPGGINGEIIGKTKKEVEKTIVQDVFDTSNVIHGRLCLDNEAYRYCTGGGEKENFARYLHVGELEPGVHQVTSKVVWYKRGYHEYEITTIVTDWRRI